jgi:hypothetical protein
MGGGNRYGEIMNSPGRCIRESGYRMTALKLLSA